VQNIKTTQPQRHQDLSGSAKYAYIHWRRRSRRNSLTKVEYKVWYKYNHSKPKSPKYTQSHKYNKRELNTKEKYSLKFSKHKSTTRSEIKPMKNGCMILQQSLSSSSRTELLSLLSACALSVFSKWPNALLRSKAKLLQEANSKAAAFFS
jgi:hypothetical protein